MMTPMNEAAYSRALDNAHRDQVSVESLRSDVAQVYSPKSIKLYTVTIQADAMACNCAATGYCKHRAAVREQLVIAAKLAQAAQLLEAAAAKMQAETRAAAKMQADWLSYSNCCGNDADRGW